MADNTPVLGLPYLVSSQSQKEVTHNESLNIIDILLDRTVKSITITTPPASSAEGDAYIIAVNATGDWLSKDGQIAQYIGGSWKYYTPRQGWLFYVVDVAKYYKRSASAWMVTAL